MKFKTEDAVGAWLLGNQRNAVKARSGQTPATLSARLCAINAPFKAPALNCAAGIAKIASRTPRLAGPSLRRKLRVACDALEANRRSDGFRGDAFANPAALVQWITGQGASAKLRPDMKLVVMRNWDTPEERLKGTRQLMQTLVKLAA